MVMGADNIARDPEGMAPPPVPGFKERPIECQSESVDPFQKTATVKREGGFKILGA